MANEPGKWNLQPDIPWLDYTVQPPKGLIKGSYYRAENRFGQLPWLPGHTGILEVVRDDDGNIVWVEFNEITSDKYYCHYFANRSKRRSGYGIWQASRKRQAKAGVVMNNGLLDLERQIMERQSLEGEFDLLTSASNSTKAMRELITAVHEQMKEPSDQRYYGLSRDFGYGITGWLQVLVQDGRIIRCLYDEVFADHPDDIWYPELKAYFKQSKYYSPNFEEPFPPGWSKNGWQIGFTDLMEMLSQQVVNNQDLLDLTGLPHVEGENLGPLWNRKEPYDEPDYNILPGTPIPRYPVWDNYLALARPMLEVLTQDGWTPGRPADS